MTSYVPVRKNDANGAIFYVALSPRTANGQFQSNPTLASGDVKISKDGGAFSNLATLPDVDPDSGKAVKVTLSQSETNADNIQIVFSDAAGAEWCDLFINIQTAARNLEDLAYPTTSGRSIDVSAGGEVGLDWANIGSPTSSVNLSGTTISTSQGVASVSGAVGSVTGNVGGNVTGSVGSVASGIPSAASIADAVWEEALADHSGTAGSTAEQLAAAGSAGDPWATALPGSYTSGQAGKLVGDYLDAAVSTRATQTSVDDLPTNAELSTALGTADDAVLTAIGALNDLSSGDVETAVGAALATYDPPTKAELDSAVSSLATAANLATVDTVVDAIKAKTDSLTFTVAGQVDSNVQYVNDVQVTGTGTDGDEWGPA